jgi:hypothetical protein
MEAAEVAPAAELAKLRHEVAAVKVQAERANARDEGLTVLTGENLAMRGDHELQPPFVTITGSSANCPANRAQGARRKG